MNEIVDQPYVTLYPNPTDSKIQINAEHRIETLKCFQSNGQLVFETTPESKQFELSVQELPNGVYFIQTSDELGFVSQLRFIKGM